MLLVSGVDRGEMIVAIVLDKPLAEAQALVDTLMPLQRRSRGETPKIGLKYGPTFKGQNQPPKMLS